MKSRFCQPRKRSPTPVLERDLKPFSVGLHSTLWRSAGRSSWPASRNWLCRWWWV